MPDGPYLTPDEEGLLRMLRESGSPEMAGQSLIQRLEALEAAVAALEASQAEDAADTGRGGEQAADAPPAS